VKTPFEAFLRPAFLFCMVSANIFDYATVWNKRYDIVLLTVAAHEVALHIRLIAL